MPTDQDHLIFFVDDFGTRTGSKTTDPTNMPSHEFTFGLGGVIVPSEAVARISSATEAFCQRWNVPGLHGSKIRGAKGSFGFLKKDKAVKDRFFHELEEVLIDDQITAHACVICRPGYRERYHEKYPPGVRWEMSRTAFDIAVERAAKYARSQDRKLAVVYERCGEAEDRRTEEYFHRLKAGGTEFDEQKSMAHLPLTADEFSETLMSIWPDGKSNWMLQLADLVVHPICQRPTHLPNRAYDRLEAVGQLIDARTNDPTIAIKYSCYDERYQNWVPPKNT